MAKETWLIKMQLQLVSYQKLLHSAEAMLIESLKYPHIQFRILPVEERERRTSLGYEMLDEN